MPSSMLDMCVLVWTMRPEEVPQTSIAICSIYTAALILERTNMVVTTVYIEQ